MTSPHRVRIGRILILLVLCLSACASVPAVDARERFGLRSTNQKLLDNHGENFDPLYGVRNFRAVLANIFYRGGANNKFNRYGTRPNQNPLPDLGLQNLCREGFDTAIYLYSMNFETAPKKVDCTLRKSGKPNSLEYLQISPYNEPAIRSVLAIAYRKIKAPTKVPAYAHCWNGWHASGLISAYTLRQFCGVSGDEAVRYWDLNTDGNNSDPNFEKIRKNIREFVPYPDFQITEDERKKLCLPEQRG